MAIKSRKDNCVTISVFHPADHFLSPHNNKTSEISERNDFFLKTEISAWDIK